MASAPCLRNARAFLLASTALCGGVFISGSASAGCTGTTGSYSCTGAFTQALTFQSGTPEGYSGGNLSVALSGAQVGTLSSPIRGNGLVAAPNSGYAATIGVTGSTIFANGAGVVVGTTDAGASVTLTNSTVGSVAAGAAGTGSVTYSQDGSSAVGVVALGASGSGNVTGTISGSVANAIGGPAVAAAAVAGNVSLTIGAGAVVTGGGAVPSTLLAQLPSDLQTAIKAFNATIASNAGWTQTYDGPAIVAGTSVSNASVTISNAGVITGTNGWSIVTVGSPTSLTNTGTINGSVWLSNGSTLTNNAGGVINISNGELIADTLANSGGTINAIGGVNNHVHGNLTNAGTINLVGGAPGNVLSVFGNYVGNGGSLYQSVSTQSNTSDQLYISGNASGSTTVNVNNVTPSSPLTTNIPLIYVGGTLAANAFSLGTLSGFSGSGTIMPVLLTTATATSTANGLGGATISLGYLPTAQSVATSVVTNTAAANVAWVGNQAVLGRVTELRDAVNSNSEPGSAPLAYTAFQASTNPASSIVKDGPAAAAAPKLASWIRVYGDIENRQASTTLTYGGSTVNYNLGYTQRGGGFVGGSDAIFSGITKANDAIIAGAFAGYVASNVSLRTDTGEHFSGGTVGAYGTYLNGPLFIDLVGKVDLLGLNIAGPGLNQTSNLQNYSAVANAGYKIDLPENWYVEPTAGLEYVRTIYDQTTALTASTIALNDAYYFRGRAGARVGFEWTTNNVRYEPSVMFLVYDAFSVSQTPTAALSSIGTLTLPSDQGRARGEVEASLNIADLGSGWSGFVRSDVWFQDDLVGGMGKAGVRYRW